jgi:hypothetical protein
MKKEDNIAAIQFEKKLKLMGASPMTEAESIQTDHILKNAFFKEKYRKGLKTLAKLEMQSLQKQHPNWHLNDVLSAILKDCNPELPPTILLELTQSIISEWENPHQVGSLVC